MQLRTLASLVLLALAVACATAPTANAPRSIVTADLDRNVNACDDFYRFANGSWLTAHPIPPAYSAWGRTQELAEHNRNSLHQILDEAAARRASLRAESDERKLATLYASCMDEAAADRAGVQAIAAELAAIDGIQSNRDLSAAFGRLLSEGIRMPWNFVAEPDPKDSDRTIAGLGQSGLGLPERDYYFREDDRSKEIRSQYLDHVAAMLHLAGDSESATHAAAIMQLETEIARASRTKAALRDPDANYHLLTIQALADSTPHTDWDSFRRAIGAPPFDAVDVGQPEFLAAVDALIANQPLDTWKQYLRWRVIDASAASLSKPFVDEDFHFGGTVLAGRKENLPRWRRCVDAADNLMGEALGKLYVARYFPPEANEHAKEMIGHLVDALDAEIGDLPWMGAATRQQAQAKLQSVVRKIGYPERWRDYSALALSEQQSFAANVAAANRFEAARTLSFIGKPVDKSEWDMTPPTVNAENNPQFNAISFPAGILQPPFFDPNADDAYNYGGMGAVIGHELIHGFDDQGRKFDARGNLTDWWSANDAQQFESLSSCVEQQFAGYDVGDGVHMNGKLVLGESIADLGGLQIAYRAYEASLEGKERRVIDGFTPEQRFFIGWARAWARNATPQAERLQATTNEHPISRFRANGPTSNMPEFAKAFGCPAGSPMVRANRCAIW